jgi:hypothetical protein
MDCPEPLDLISFQFLTYKCCFLLALATGRKRSEFHALSVSEIDHFESYIAPVDCLTAPEMHMVAFSEKPLCLIDVLTATMCADGVSPGLDQAYHLLERDVQLHIPIISSSP